MRLLITGGCGFIGSNFIRYVLDHYGPEQVTNVDALTRATHALPANAPNPAGALSTVADVVAHHPGRYEFFQADIADAARMDELLARHPYYAVVNFAAEIPVQPVRGFGEDAPDVSVISAADAERLQHSNVEGVSVLLDCARRHGVKRFLQISTSAVYGALASAEAERCTEQTPLPEHSSASPLSHFAAYAASKAEAERLALEHHRRHGAGALEVIIARSSANYGPFQSPEKKIPKTILNALRDLPLDIKGEGADVRDWLHVEDHCRALFSLLLEGTPGGVYNIGGGVEISDLEIARLILKRLGKPESRISFDTEPVEPAQRYALDAGKLQSELQWQALHRPERGIAETVDWYVSHRAWWEPLLS